MSYKHLAILNSFPTEKLQQHYILRMKSASENIPEFGTSTRASDKSETGAYIVYFKGREGGKPTAMNEAKTRMANYCE